MEGEKEVVMGNLDCLGLLWVVFYFLGWAGLWYSMRLESAGSV